MKNLRVFYYYCLLVLFVSCLTSYISLDNRLELNTQQRRNDCVIINKITSGILNWYNEFADLVRNILAACYLSNKGNDIMM